MFGEVLRGHRERRGATQEDLAARSGISARHLRDLESGRITRPRARTLRLIAEALGLDGDEREGFLQAGLGAASAPPSTVPAQLPMNVRGLVGRESELAQLDAMLDAAGRTPTTVLVSALSGTAGVGKTALAVACAHRVRDRFPDGQLYVNLRGFDPAAAPMDPGQALRGFLDALHIPAQRVPADLDAQTALYRSTVAGRRMLVVLDNARDSEQVRPLLPGTAGCLVLVTSRNHLSSLVAVDGAHPVRLEVLSVDEARQMLARRLGERRVEAEPKAVHDLIASCARLPLALAVVAARAAAHPHFALAAIAAELADSRDRLDALTTGDPDTDVRAVFSWSYHTLSPQAARLFRLLGLHPGPDISTAAAASLAGTTPAQVRRVLAELTRAIMLTEHAAGRYTFHDLLRTYATDRAESQEPEDQRRAATGRMLDHYLHTGYAAARLLNPYRDPIGLAAPRSGTSPESLADYGQALAWFSTEHAVLTAVVDRAADTGMHTHTWQLAWSLNNFLDLRGHWHDWERVLRAAVAAADQSADPATQGLTHRLLALAYIRLNRLDDANSQLQQALDLYQRAGDQAGQGHTHHNLGLLWERRSRSGDALHHHQQALKLFQAVDHRLGQALSYNSMGLEHARLDEPEQAVVACRQALTMMRELGDPYGEAATWHSLGYAYHRLGDHAEAVACYQHSLRLVRQLSDPYYEAMVLTHLADTRHAAGDVATAREDWTRSLAILDDLGHPDAEELRVKLTADPPG